MRKPREALKNALHPFLLAWYLGSFTYVSNMDGLEFASAVRTLAVVFLATFVLVVALSIVFRDVTRGAFLTSIFELLFFSYGHLYLQLSANLPVKLDPYGWHAILLPVWFTLLAAGVLVTVAQGHRLSIPSRYLNAFGGVLVVMSLGNIAAYEAFKRSAFNPAWWEASADEIQATPPAQPPDIYYIILDEYSGNSVLRDFYGYDNSPFSDYLEERGFFVAHESRANYPHTFLSMSSSLNMQYIDGLAEDVGAESSDTLPTFQLIDGNLVAQVLGNAGYRFVQLSSGWGATERNRLADEDNVLKDRLTAFEIFFGFHTWLNPVMPLINYQTTRQRILTNFDILSQLPERDDGPTFVFAHFLVPHAPYVFRTEDGPPAPTGQSVDGIVLDEDAYAEHAAYLEQIGFTNRIVRQTVDEILSKSAVPPIILIQSDHGNRLDVDHPVSWGAEEYDRYVMPIQNAYFLPDGGDESLYACISPVNSFRVILDTYFGTELGLLEDKSYYSALDTPYDMVELPSHCERD